MSDFIFSSDEGRLVCPLCSRRNWAQLDHDFWRLEKWLDFAEGTQSEQISTPSSMEKLEDIIRDHREFMLDMDSHTCILTSLNVVGAHLNDHTERTEHTQEMHEKLELANARWKKVVDKANKWQQTLRMALMQNQQFQKVVEELSKWLEKVERRIRSSQPIDFTENVEKIRAKYNKFR